MPQKSLPELPFELIKAHVLDPENSPLHPTHQEMFDRLVSAAKILDKNPIRKNAVAIHRHKHPGLSLAQAYRDLNLAAKLFNSLHTFDYDFWQTWIINSCLKNIDKAQSTNSPQDRKIIAMEHANLIKAIGKKPDNVEDPLRNEKHQFFININLDGGKMTIDLNNLDKLPEITLRELNRHLFSGKEITVEDAKVIMET